MYTHIYVRLQVYISAHTHIREQSAYLVCSKLPTHAHCETRSNAVICSVGNGGGDGDGDGEFGTGKKEKHAKSTEQMIARCANAL